MHFILVRVQILEGLGFEINYALLQIFSGYNIIFSENRANLSF